MVKKSIYISLLFLTTFICAQNINITASTDSTNYTVGDYINYTLEVKRSENIKVDLSSVSDSIKVLEFIKKLEPVKENYSDGILEKHTFVFSKYDSAEFYIPALSIPYYIEPDSTNLKYTNTNEIFLSVTTLPVDLQGDVQDIKDPKTIAFDYLTLIYWVLGVLLILVAIGYFWYRRYKSKQQQDTIKPKIVIPPHEEALKDLRELETKELWQKGRIKEYHSEITFVIRRYIERKYGILALELPSSELITLMKNNSDTTQILDATKDFLTNADMVKFAKFVPPLSVNEMMMEQAYEIVNKTKPSLSEHTEEVQNV